MVTRRLHLLRHTPAAIAPGICYGRSDLPLQTPPTAHAAALRAQLPAGLPIFSSPLQRCAQLARLLGEPVLDARLMELDFGDWELQPYAALPRAALDAWAADHWGFRPPGGECGADMAARVIACVDELLARHEEWVIVSHGGPLRVLAGHLLGLPREAWLAQAMPLGACVRLDCDAQGRWLRA